MLDTFIALTFAAVFLTIGFVVINLIPLLKRLQLPVLIVAGLLGLLVAHISIGSFDVGVNARGVIPEKYFLQLQQVPGIFINIVFATLMLGMPKLNIGESIRLAAPNIVMGHGFAWGQHFVGALLAIFVFSYFYENSQYMAPLIAIGFQGGHGTGVYALADYGGATATTASGLLLADVADPKRLTS